MASPSPLGCFVDPKSRTATQPSSFFVDTPSRRFLRRALYAASSTTKTGGCPSSSSRTPTTRSVRPPR